MIALLKWWREFALVALLAALLYAWHAHNLALIGQGKAIERARVADSALAVLRPALARTDTVLIRDTVRLTRLTTTLQTIHDTVLTHLTDTVLVKQYITTADSTVRACTDLLGSCTIFRRQALATIAALEVKVAAVPIAVPRSCVSTGAVSALVAAGVAFYIGQRH